jgi:hypothetical protein
MQGYLFSRALPPEKVVEGLAGTYALGSSAAIVREALVH